MAFVQSIKHDKYTFIDPMGDGQLKDCAMGQTILVTGSSSGIGKAIAEYFAIAGAKNVIIAARNSDELALAGKSIRGLAPNCKVFEFITDVSDGESVNALFSSIQNLEGLGVPHVLVNNAGSCVSIISVIDSNPENWWRDSECNIKGTYLCSRAYLQALNGSPGTIINTSSGASSGVAPGFSGYSVGKAAVNRLTEYISAEHSSQGVTCIAFHPGGVGSTNMSQTAPEWLKPHLVDTTDLSAGTCLYLSTTRANFLTGRYVSSNWDMEEVESKKQKILAQDLLKTRVAFY